ncbi:MAG: hypothetical protein J6Y53_00635 [Alphaproteobacteria bacterium]|nr:hypothetical protein [Alphaproteobacteria bacterium]
MRNLKAIRITIFLVILCFVAWKCFVFLMQNSCLDAGNVWDYKEKRCRDDCLVWNKINGCVMMTYDQVKLFEKCRHKPVGCISNDVIIAICMQNNLPFNPTTGECDAEFTLDKCYKHGKDWIYPDVCNENGLS